MHVLRTGLGLLLLVLPFLASRGQEPSQTPADVTPGAVHTASRDEPAVAGFVRRDADHIVLTLPGGKSLILHDFDFNGDPVDTSKLHLRLKAPGVYELESLAWDVGYWRFYVDDSASYYGLGERFDTLDHARTVVHNLSTDTHGSKGSATSKPMPFFMSTSGYGMWLDTTGDATFDFNATNRTQILIDMPSNRLRLLLFTGEGEQAGRFPAILSAFSALAGRVVVPPYWAFAPWQGSGDQLNQQQVGDAVDQARELGLPASVILIESPWAAASNAYRFNPEHFDDAKGMVKHLHESGYKLVLGHTSWIDNKAAASSEAGSDGKPSNYDLAVERNFLVKDQNDKPIAGKWRNGEGSLIDFTYPKARDWWQEQVAQAIDSGADGFEDEGGEGDAIRQDLKFYDRTDARLMRNRYGTLYNNALEDLIQTRLRGNGVLLCSSVTTGANGLGFLKAGDSETSFSTANGLPALVTAGISAGLSGLPLWSAGFGRYEKTPDPLLTGRWTEYAAFTPVMEVAFDARTSSTQALDLYRKYAVLHMSLFPYRYAAAQQAALTGRPMIRGLVFDYQDDPKARTIKDEYLFGPDLLIAPVVDENTSRPVYLPAGDWLDFFTGEAFHGPVTVIAKAPADGIPVYLRRGAIVPKIPDDVMTLVTAAESGNKTIHALDARRVFEIAGPAADHDTSALDFEGRRLVRSGNTLKIFLPPHPSDEKRENARAIVRWRFTTPRNVTVNGAVATITNDSQGQPAAEFDLTADTTVVWQ